MASPRVRQKGTDATAENRQCPTTTEKHRPANWGSVIRNWPLRAGVDRRWNLEQHTIKKKEFLVPGDRLRITNCASSNGSCWASGKNLGLRDGWSFFGDQRGDLISNNRTCQHSFFFIILPSLPGLAFVCWKGCFVGRCRCVFSFFLLFFRIPERLGLEFLGNGVFWGFWRASVRGSGFYFGFVVGWVFFVVVVWIFF